MRSRPHDGGFGWSVWMVTVWFCCTNATSGSAANCFACASLIEAAKPSNAAS